MRACPVCGDAPPLALATLDDVPVYCNVLWPTREEALAAPLARVELVFCGSCGMIWNAAFDPALLVYSESYENSLHFSRVFQEYAEGLAARLVDRFGLHGKDVLEIGSGKGEFLQMLCRAGGNRGVGFDPSYEGALEGGDGVRYVRDLYSEAYAEVPAEFVCCRHVLEHVDRPVEFLRGLRRALGDRDSALYFEVPAAEYLLSRLSGWDIIYEHCSIFGLQALERAFAAAGFQVLDRGFSFGDQYAWIEARTGPTTASSPSRAAEVERPADAAATFDARFRATVEAWTATLEQLRARGPVAVWGAGSKGVTFANLVGGDAVAALVDVNPRKHGRYVPGTGHRVVSPSELAAYAPSAIVAMNPLYLDEIAVIARAADVAAEVIAA